MAQRELPKGIGTCFRLALQHWFALSDRDRLRSTMGPPEAALERLAQLDGRRDPSEYYAQNLRGQQVQSLRVRAREAGKHQKEQQ